MVFRMQVTVKTVEQSEFHEISSLVGARSGQDGKTATAMHGGHAGLRETNGGRKGANYQYEQCTHVKRM